MEEKERLTEEEKREALERGFDLEDIEETEFEVTTEEAELFK